MKNGAAKKERIGAAQAHNRAGRRRFLPATADGRAEAAGQRAGASGIRDAG